MLLSGCSLFCAECGYLPYAENYAPPPGLPAPASYERAEADWSRTAAFGINGSMRVTFESPTYQAAALAWSADRSHLGSQEIEALLQNRWQERYAGGTRLPFLVSIKLDRRFYSRKQFELSEWQFSLADERGRLVLPTSVERPKITEDEDFLSSRFIVYFPRRDAQGTMLFESPRLLRFRSDSPLTRSDFTWRFRPLSAPLPDHG